MNILGVEITHLKKIPDERGCIFHMMRVDDPLFEKFGEVYFSTAYPQVIKGWHEHTRQTQNYAVISGMIKLVLFDNRNDSPTFGKLMELFVGDLNYVRVRIPPGVINGYKCISESSCIVANCSDLPHQQGEMIRHSITSNIVEYDWDLKVE